MEVPKKIYCGQQRILREGAIPIMSILTSNSSAMENKIASHRITSCAIGRMFYFYQGRNAWNWSWSQTYPGDDAFTLSLEESKRRIEKRRVQGSTWWIEELPACIFSGTKYSLVIAEINTQTPLADFVKITFNKPMIREVAAAFQQLRPNSLVKFVCSVDSIDTSRGTLKRFKSHSYGGNYSLGWFLKNENIRYSSYYIKRIIKRCSKQF